MLFCECSFVFCVPVRFFWKKFLLSESCANFLEWLAELAKKIQNFSFSFRPLSYLHLPALLSIMPSSSPRGQGGPTKSATELRFWTLKKRPLQFLWIPCLCGGKHTTSICPTEQTTTTTIMVTSCGGTNFNPRKGKRQYRVPSIGHRWTEFRWQAQRRKISVDMTEHHCMTLIKQPCGYYGKRQPDTKYTNSNCWYPWILIAWLLHLLRVSL